MSLPTMDKCTALGKTSRRGADRLLTLRADIVLWFLLTISSLQMMTCRDVARVGTLVVNQGLWPTADNPSARLVAEDYMAQIGKPSFPAFNKGYGFLTWLNTDVGPEGPHCCAPRWSSGVGFVNQTRGNVTRHGSCCAALNGSNTTGLPCDLFATNSLDEAEGSLHYEGAQYIERSIIQDNTPAGLPQAPADLMMGQGLDGQYLFIIPSLNVTIVTMGSSNPKSRLCFDGYDDAYTVSLAWNAISDVFATVSGHPPHDARTQERKGAPKTSGGRVGRATPALQPHQHHKQRAEARAGAPVVGSCQCDCPSDMGYGRCFDVTAEEIPPRANPFSPGFNCLALKPNSTTAKKIRSAPSYCPERGVTASCDPRKHPNASLLCLSHMHRCRVLKECGPVEGMPDSFAVMTCACPTPAEMTPCVWSRKPCSFTPYYTPG